eukprot:Gb_01344 [translate_table: standard]
MAEEGISKGTKSQLGHEKELQVEEGQQPISYEMKEAIAGSNESGIESVKGHLMGFGEKPTNMLCADSEDGQLRAREKMRGILVFVRQKEKGVKVCFTNIPFDGIRALLGYSNSVGFQHRDRFSSSGPRNLMICAWDFLGSAYRARSENPVEEKTSQHLQKATLASSIWKQKKERNGPMTKKVQPEKQRIAVFENIVDRENYFRFVVRTKEFLAKQPEPVLQLNEDAKLYRELGFPRGRKVTRYIEKHPALFQVYRHTDGKMWFGFSSLMEKLLEEEGKIMDEMEKSRVDIVRKLLMMSADKRISMSKIQNCRHIFGLPDDFRDIVKRYSQFFRVVEEEGRRVLELTNWEPALAVTALEASYIGNEDKIKQAFVFPVSYGKHLKVGKQDVQNLNMLNTLPLVSPYSDTSNLNPRSLEGQKYRVGLIHEFVSLTLEKKASIHLLAEFKDEFKLTTDTYHLLLKQSRTFYLAGTEMNWTVFLKDAYRGEELIEKNPLVVFKEKLFNYGYLKQGNPKLKEIMSAYGISQDEQEGEEQSEQEVESGKIS